MASVRVLPPVLSSGMASLSLAVRSLVSCMVGVLLIAPHSGTGALSARLMAPHSGAGALSARLTPVASLDFLVSLGAQWRRLVDGLRRSLDGEGAVVLFRQVEQHR